MEELINIEGACEQLKISREIYLRILFKAVEQTRQDLDRLQKACEQNDINTIQAIAHRLKGDYANLRIEQLSGIANGLNMLAKHEYDSLQAKILIDQFKVSFEHVASLLSEQN
ncbi:MAG: Hpt domain-containing protein [Candidatus Omnitrophota bacterium]